MNTGFTYYILNYVHSQFLEEKLNVGILFHFKSTNKVFFKYPKNFKRLREVYSNFSEWQLKTNLRAIEEKVINYNHYSELLFSKLKEEEFGTNSILKSDATALRFSEPKIAVEYTTDLNLIIDSYYKLYFSEYKTEYKKEKHDEEYLLRNFKQLLSSQSNTVQNLFTKDVQIKSTTNRSVEVAVKFEYQWQNGVTNLVKPVSFDLEEENSISNKAILLHGQLNFIAEEIAKNNFNVDLLIAAPTNRNNLKLTKAYNNALKILDDVGIKKNIVQEFDVDKYVQRVLSQIHSPNSESSNYLKLPNQNQQGLLP